MLSRLALNLRPTFLTSVSTAARAFSSTTPTVHQGTVRAFDSRRGYGFITPEDGSDDVFLHQTQIRRVGFRFVQAGEAVEFQMVQGDKGRKAINVTGPGGEVLPPRSNSDRPYTPRGEGESSGPRD
ncbi:glycine-rich protein [Nannochloropsis oceanica]